MHRIGVLLSGCGIYDGSEAQETVLLILALRRRGLIPVFLAPDVEQMDVVSHSTGEVDESAAPRRVLDESARLTRGVVRPLGEVAEGELDALVIPGGLGAVKNLCLPGRGPLGGGAPRPAVATLLDDLASRRSPVAALGLGDVVLARHQGRPLDPGPVSVPATRVTADEARNSLFTPGFMTSDSVTEVAEGVELLVEQLQRRLAGAARGPGS